MILVSGIRVLLKEFIMKNKQLLSKKFISCTICKNDSRKDMKLQSIRKAFYIVSLCVDFASLRLCVRSISFTVILSSLGLMILSPLSGWTQTPTGAEILKKIDENTIAGNRSATTTMIVHGRRGDRTMTAKSWVEGSEKSFSEYLAPAREKGTKMLKLGDQLWLYSPQSDRIIRIAGHMLRQSMMGSDFSYEDMMEDHSLSDAYSAKILGSESFLDRDCWVLELTAIVDDVAYFSRKIWVDKERMLALREDRFAKGGKLLKTAEVLEVFRVNLRWYPKRMVFKDALSKGKGTELVINSIEFDVKISKHIFSKAALRK